MKRLKNLISLLLLFSMLLVLCACGNNGVSAGYRIISASIGSGELCVAFRDGDALGDAVTAALKKLAADGALSSISLKWTAQDLVTLEGDVNALEHLNYDSSQRTELIVGLDMSRAPLSFKSGGRYEGFDIDAASAVCDLFGWELKLQPIDAENVSVELASGNIDCAFGSFGESVSGYVLSPAYMEFEYVLAVPTSSRIKRLSQLKGKTICAISDQPLLAALDADTRLSEKLDSVQTLPSAESCLNSISNGFADAAVIDSISAIYYMK